jgi:quercetin dioxygenase-like cupin family protein
MTEKEPILRQSSTMERTETRRKGLFARRLITASDSRLQNVALMDAEVGATVEYHKIDISESFFILEGVFEVLLDQGETRRIGPGDLCYFYPDTSHGIRCVEGPGRFLIVFAPSGGAPKQ